MDKIIIEKGVTIEIGGCLYIVTDISLNGKSFTAMPLRSNEKATVYVGMGLTLSLTDIIDSTTQDTTFTDVTALADNTRNADQDFVWTDENVTLFTAQYSLGAFGEVHVPKAIEQFKSSKQRVPLFTTEDGVAKYKDDPIFLVTKCYNWIRSVSSRTSLDEEYIARFDKQDAAENYILFNKETLSVQNVKNIYAAIMSRKGILYWEELEEGLKQLVKI